MCLFRCNDGTCLEEQLLCDGVADCLQTQTSPGGEDEDGGECGSGDREIPTPAAQIQEKKEKLRNKNYVEISISANSTLILSLQTMVTLSILQLPAVCLAVYGVFCAMWRPGLKNKITDTLLSLLLVFMPFCLVEIFTLLKVEFAEKGVQFLIDRVKDVSQKLTDLLCGGCSDKVVAKLDLLKFLPNKDPSGKDRAVSVEACKLVCGTCLQLCYQCVLLGGYTSEEQFETSQVISIVSSVFTIVNTGQSIVKFKRLDHISTNEEETLKMKLTKWIKQQLKNLKQLFLTLPLLLTSLIFQTGTLVLTILVVEWYAVIYVIAVLVLNMVLSLLLPFPAVQKWEYKLKLTNKFPILEGDKKKVKEGKILRGIFSSWANLFIILRPVENISYHKITHMCLLQPIRFILNLLTLTLLILLTYAPSTSIWPLHRHGSYLLVTYVVVIVAGFINLLAMIHFSFYGNIPCLSKPPKQTSIKMNTIEQGNANGTITEEIGSRGGYIEDYNLPVKPKEDDKENNKEHEPTKKISSAKTQNMADRKLFVESDIIRSPSSTKQITNMKDANVKLEVLDQTNL